MTKKVHDLLYSAHFLAGKGKRHGSQRAQVVHAVKALPLGTSGDNFNVALCGKTPSGKSLGWFDTDADINCEKCIEIIGL